jgi:hypothetical protein
MMGSAVWATALFLMGQIALAGDHAHAPAEAVHPVPLIEAGAARGVKRYRAQPIRPGGDHASPALAVSSTGKVVQALVSWEKTSESIYVRIDQEPVFAVSDGARASHPALAAGPDGAVWLAWSGSDGVPKAGDHRRQIWVRRVLPTLGKALMVSDADRRASAPSLALGRDGAVHVAWERGAAQAPLGSRIAYRTLKANGRPAAGIVLLTGGYLNRRPCVAIDGDALYVAWDRLVDRKPTGASDPDFDVMLLVRKQGRWGEPILIDGRDGIQAAVSMAPDPAGGVLLAYHSSHQHGLVKWWQLRRYRGGKIERLAHEDPAGLSEPSGEQQGAEFPSLTVLPGGRLAIFSRPSQGAYLQIVDANGVSRPLDLTRSGWGARGMRIGATVDSKGELWMVRRARHEAVLERFQLKTRPAGPPEFTTLVKETKALKQPISVSPQSALGIPKKGHSVYYGDLHMHSAASDATGAPDEVLARAWVRGYQFAALTDHDNIVGKRQFPSMQEEIAWLSDFFDSRSGFTVLHAYEWTSPPLPKGFGHRNVYFRDRPQAGWCAFRGACSDSKKLFAELRAGQAIAVAHHTTWTGTDWDAADERIQRLVEIVSVHGLAERPGKQPIVSRGKRAGMYLIDGLARGLKFGFVGGSDAHGLLWHHGLGRKRDPWACGLTGLVAKAGNRAALFDAMFARRSIATSGLRLQVFITADDLPMGAQGPVGAQVRLRFGASGASGTRLLELLRDGQVIHRRQLGGPDRPVLVEYQDKLDPGSHTYYVRLTVEGDVPELAFSSPIFVTVEGER